MLKFNSGWRFDSPGEIPVGVINEFSSLIGKIAAQGERQRILEHFKSYFAGAAGTTSSWSSNCGWAETDLQNYMEQAAHNAPLFIEAFWDACEAIHQKSQSIAVPELSRINRILQEHSSGYHIQPPDLVSHNYHQNIVVSAPAKSFTEQAQDIIQSSLRDAEQLLAEGRHRQAVHEILWLLETVSTAFSGLETETGTVQGKYFNNIARDLRRLHRGQTLDQVLSWITALHGYLSSPTGGGIRHGADLRADIATHPNDARLYCNLIRSYISFLMQEHERLTKSHSAGDWFRNPERRSR
jgi:hypothetical protein